MVRTMERIILPPLQDPGEAHQHQQYTSKGSVKGCVGNIDVSYAAKLRPLLAHPILGLQPVADRFSNPSGGLGYGRFNCWPLGSDSYAHAQLTANWDEADAIIGIPSSGNWPPTTGINGGIYAVCQGLADDAWPIGTTFAFIRPTTDVPIPDGCVVCIGQTLTPEEHSFPNISGSVTLPDLRNVFILGADSTYSIGQAGVTVTSGNINNNLGAPGPQGIGGQNESTRTEAQLATHDHGGTTGTPDKTIYFEGGGGSNFPVSNGAGTSASGTHTHTIPEDGSGAPIDNRPNYVGLIYLCKVLRLN